MLIDCDTCTARGAGCADCVVTVLLGAPPGRETGPVVVPLRGPGGRPAPAAPAAAHEPPHETGEPQHGVLVELDEVERRAVRALADGGLVPPLRHQQADHQAHQHGHPEETRGGVSVPGRRTG